MMAAAGIKTVLLAVWLGASIACDREDERQLGVEEESPVPASAEGGLSDLIARHRQRIMSIPGVVGMGVGKCARNPNELCVLVYTATDEWPSELPRRLDGYDVELRKAGGDFRPLRGFDRNGANNDDLRPAVIRESD